MKHAFKSTMEESLDRWQRKALSEHAGNVILEYYQGHPPQWTAVGTETQGKLRSMLAQRLREKECGDVAEFLDENPKDTTRAIQQRFKSLREKKRREDKKREVDKEGMLQVAGFPSDSSSC